jgi:hypothetical protein
VLDVDARDRRLVHVPGGLHAVSRQMHRREIGEGAAER